MEKLMKVPEFAEVYGVHHDTVYRWIRQGKLKAVRVGRSVRVFPPKAERKVRMGGET